MSRGPNLNRRADLERALKRSKADDEITIDVMAALWGVSKQRFVNIMREMEKQVDFPAWRLGPRQVHVFPAKATIGVLLEYEKRNDEETEAMQKRASAILGRGDRKGRKREPTMLPISELATMSRVMMETEARERDQGLYSSLEDQARIAGMVFSRISTFLSDLAGNIDPNGLLPNDVRAIITEGGKREALSLHGVMKDMLTGDARAHSSKPAGSRAKNGGARRAPASGARKKRVGVPAR